MSSLFTYVSVDIRLAYRIDCQSFLLANAFKTYANVVHFEMQKISQIVDARLKTASDAIV